MIKKELKIPYWIVDGVVGVLSLIIYNFILYLLTIFKIGGLIEKMEGTMGYFALNTFLDLDFSRAQIILGLLFVFAIAFALGTFVGCLVRKRYQKKGCF